MIKFYTLLFFLSSGAWAFNLPLKASELTSSGKSTAPQPSVKPVSSVKSFKEWKTERVQVAIKKVAITKAQIEYRRLNRQFIQKTNPTQIKDSELERLEALLKSDIYTLEATQELGVSTYFAAYLTKLENKNEAYKEAAAKMTPDEVNHLIKAYADSMFSTNNPSPEGIKVGPTAMERTQFPRQ